MIVWFPWVDPSVDLCCLPGRFLKRHTTRRPFDGRYLSYKKGGDHRGCINSALNLNVLFEASVMPPCKWL